MAKYGGKPLASYNALHVIIHILTFFVINIFVFSSISLFLSLPFSSLCFSQTLVNSSLFMNFPLGNMKIKNNNSQKQLFGFPRKKKLEVETFFLGFLLHFPRWFVFPIGSEYQINLQSRGVREACIKSAGDKQHPCLTPRSYKQLEYKGSPSVLR